MQILRYWAQATANAPNPEGGTVPIRVWGGSPISDDDAKAIARKRLAAAVDRIIAGRGFPNAYSYGSRQLREEIVQEFSRDDGRPLAVITRNLYGALVLNTADVAFIDVDFSPPPRLFALRGLLARLMGRHHQAMTDPAEEPLAKLRRWIDETPEAAVRVYRTRAGLRYLLTHALLEPDAPSTDEFMQRLGADPRYRRLCRNQRSFRARLTPKAFRIGLRPPKVRFPWASADCRQQALQWQQRYAQVSSGYATCQLMETLGSGQTHREIDAVMRLHDEFTRAHSALPLA